MTYDICKDIAAAGYPLSENRDLEETVNLVRDLGRKATGLIAHVSKADEVKVIVD